MPAPAPLLTLTAFEVGGHENPLVGPLDLVVAGGETVAVLGPSGAGKSQLLRGLAALEPARWSAATVRGDELATLSPTERRRRLLFVHQEPVRFEGDVRANLMRVRELFGSHAVPWETVVEWLDFLGLGEADLAKAMESLSGGEAARVALVRALQVAVNLVLVDEPTAALDERAAEAVIALLDRWKREAPDRAVLWAQHPDERTAEACDRFLVLGAGGASIVEHASEARALLAAAGGVS